MVVFVMIFQIRVGHFKPGFLSSQGSKLDNLSAHKIENFLNFSKLTQLLSVGQFWRPLAAFKQKGPVLLSGAVKPIIRSIYFSTFFHTNNGTRWVEKNNLSWQSRAAAAAPGFDNSAGLCEVVFAERGIRIEVIYGLESTIMKSQQVNWRV